MSSNVRAVSTDLIISYAIEMNPITDFIYKRCKAVHWLFLVCVLSSDIVNAEESTPQRIITLSPHLAELVFLLESGERLTGVSEGSDFPAAAKNIPRIGGSAGLDIERVLALQPDLVLAWSGGTRVRDLRQLQQLGLRVVSIEGATLQDISSSLQTLGELLGVQEMAAARVTEFNTKLKMLTDKYQGLPQHKIFIEISSRPLMGLTNHHSFGAGLKLCGLENIFSDADKETVVVDLEAVLARGTEIVLLRKETDEIDSESRNRFYQLNNDEIRLVSFDADKAFRQTPRLLDAIDQVCASVHFK